MSNDIGQLFSFPKILCHEDRLTNYISQYKENRERVNGIVPITVEIDISNKCSHKCPLCVGRRFSNSKDEQLYPVFGDGEEIPLHRALDYISQIAHAGVKALIFTGGGEPTVHADFDKIINEANKLNLDVGLITHGGLLHTKNIKTLVKNCTWIRVSIDAANPNEYRITHGRETREWERVWDNVKKLSSISRSLGNNGATIGTGFLTGENNAASFLKFAALSKEANVHYAQARPFHSQIEFDAMPFIQKAKEKLDSDTFKVLASVQKYSLVRNRKVEIRNYNSCHIAHFASVICANEKAYICCHLRNVDKYCVGDLREESFSEIINGYFRADINSTVNVHNCISLCRGDHVNRVVQKTLQNGKNSDINAQKCCPPHKNFL